jgi:hypothetical protein
MKENWTLLGYVLCMLLVGFILVGDFLPTLSVEAG